MDNISTDVLGIISALGDKINNVESKLDSIMHTLNQQAEESINLQGGGLIDIANIVSNHEEEIQLLKTIVEKDESEV